MEVKETQNEGLKRGYTITLTATELDAKVDEKLQEAAPNVSIKGFRKGKVPMAHLKKMFGKSVLGEALQESIDGAVNKQLEDSGDRPAMRPEVKMVNEDWEEGQDVEVTVAYEKLPDVPEIDYSKIKVERVNVEVADADVEESLNNLAESATNFESRRKGSKAKDGDQVVIDFVGSIDGEEFEGGKGEAYPLTLGSGSFIPGFEEQLVGAKAGEEVDVNVKFPEEYGAENLAGKDALFKVTVQDVKEPKPAEVNDDLAKRFGADDLEGLKGQIKERLAEEYKEATRAVMKRRLMDALDTEVQFDVPESLTTAEANQIAHQLWHEENPDHHGHDHGEIEPSDEHKKLAERRVRLGLILAEVGTEQKIQVSENEMRDAIMRQAQQYGPQAAQFLQYLQQNPQMQDQIRAPIFEDKVVDYVVGQSDVTDKTISKDELEKEIEKLDQL